MADLIIGDMASRVSSPVLIGRESDLARLRAALRPGRGGTQQRDPVAGEAGVGKTRLVGSFVDLRRRAGGVVLMGGCIRSATARSPTPRSSRPSGASPGEPAPTSRGIFGHGRSGARPSRSRPRPGPRRLRLPSGLSIGFCPGPAVRAAPRRPRATRAQRPLAFIVEDLHWSDQSTRDLLGFLVRNLRDVPVMLVFTYRSDELHRRHPLLPFLAELERTGRVERIELAPFGRRDAADQLAAIAGRDLDPALVESIHARSGGNAFFAEELLAAAGDDGRTELPSTLRDVLFGRVATLAERDPGVPAGRVRGRVLGSSPL